MIAINRQNKYNGTSGTSYDAPTETLAGQIVFVLFFHNDSLISARVDKCQCYRLI